MKITFISDTHTKHHLINEFLTEGDLIIHAGDITNVGEEGLLKDFCTWFDKLDYTYKIFIAGNHDKIFEKEPKIAMKIVNSFKNIIYLQDNFTIIEGIKIYGSPWQPEFFNWAFNLPRNGKELKQKWEMIPNDIDILITHSPAFGCLDRVINRDESLGCEKLTDRLETTKPKIHVCGHIHTGYGYSFNGDTHSFNASVLNERYNFTQKPLTIEWNKNSNEFEFL